MFKRAFIFVLLGIFAIQGCQKDELTKPAKVDFLFQMNPFETEWADNTGEEETDDENGEQAVTRTKSATAENPFRNGNTPRSMAINQARLVITAIEIDGKREQGKDVFLASDFDPPLEISLEGTNLNEQDVSFDLPQGVYNKLEILFRLGQEDHPSMAFSGPVNSNAPGKVNFKFEYHPREKIKTRAVKQNQTSESIAIDKSKKTSARIVVDAEYLFRNITPNQLAESQVTNQAGGQSILVSNKNNTNIFGALNNRLEKSIAVVFE
ncbi:MAG: hypothetical protein R6U46_07430 [Marinilabilia sp.]